MKRTIGWLVAICCFRLAQGATNTVLCYYSSWAKAQKGSAQFRPADIPTGQCSHIVLYSLRPTASGGIQDFKDGATLQQLVGLKTEQPSLKVLASIGGWHAGSDIFSNIVGNLETRDSFVQALSGFVDTHRLDGIDIDWEFPASRGGAARDNSNFVVFLSELREKFGIYKIITASVDKPLNYIGPTYDVPCLSLHLDFINLMTYGYNSYNDGRTGLNAPLYSPTEQSHHSVDATIQAWIDAGASPAKLLMGLSFAGNSYTLSDPGQFEVGSPTSGQGIDGGTMYQDICSKLKEDDWTTEYDSKQGCAYSYKRDQWFSYDNVQSIRAKTQYALHNELGGVNIYSVDFDDFRNNCGTGSMPLLNAINSVMRENV